MRTYFASLLTLGLALAPQWACQKKVRFSGETAKNGDDQTGTDTKTSTDTGNPDGQPPGDNNVPQCKQVENLIGAHFYIAMDNSRSMLDTDCQKISGGTVQCAETSREKAVKAVMAGLAQMAAAHPGDARAVSSLALGRFTVRNAGEDVNFSRDVLFGPKDATGGMANELATAMGVLRNPEGDTPYMNAAKLFSYFDQSVTAAHGNDGKARVAVLITDGEATDRNPQAVRQAFSALTTRGVKVFTLMLTNGSTRAARLPEHRGFMQQYDAYYAKPQGQTWWDTRVYQGFDTYFQDLTTLPDQISQKVVELPAAQNLTDTLFKEVIAKEIKCQ